MPDPDDFVASPSVVQLEVQALLTQDLTLEHLGSGDITPAVEASRA